MIIYMNRIIFLLIMLLSIFHLSSFVFAEEIEPEAITLTTYYPAPYGDYDELSTLGNTYLSLHEGAVGINTNSPQAILDVQSSATGIIPPRMPNDPSHIDSKQGMIYYNTTSKTLRIYDGTSWGDIGSSGAKIYAAIGSDDIVLTEYNVWKPMPDMKIEKNFKSGNILISFTAPFGGVSSVNVRICVDGFAKNTVQVHAPLFQGPTNIQWVEAVSAGDHTIEIEWYAVAADVHQSGSAWNRVLTVVVS